MTSKVRDIDLLKFSTVSNVLYTVNQRTRGSLCLKKLTFAFFPVRFVAKYDTSMPSEHYDDDDDDDSGLGGGAHQPFSRTSALM